MACAAVSVPGGSSAAAAASTKQRSGNDGVRRSGSASDLAGMRRSRSEPQLRCSLSVPRAGPAAETLKTSRSVGLFPFGSMITNSIRSFLFESEAGGDVRLADYDDGDAEEIVVAQEGIRKGKKGNWVSRVLEVRRRWRDRRQKGGADEAAADEEEEEEEGESVCYVSYDSESDAEGEEGNRSEWNRESFGRLLGRASWADTKLFAQLAFLCNMAYSIPDLKVEYLWKCYGLQFVTSSLEKKSEAAIKAHLESDSTSPHSLVSISGPEAHHNSAARTSFAYEIAASAASYVHARAKGLLSLGGAGGLGQHHGDVSDASGGSPRTASSRVCNPEVAAYVAGSTMTAVVAAEEGARHQAAKDLRSAHSSPCEWYICDDPRTCTRSFIIQGSDSLASWQANLLFEPTKFEDKEVLVHRGIYEAAKGIYEQFLPEVQEHLNLYGTRARFQFTGHSLGGSLSLLVGLMLLARCDVERSALLPVVTFGSPSVFCGGRRVLDELGLDERFVRSVMMHRDIVPRAFSCSYPNQVAQVLKRLNGTFRSHPCLNSEKVLYSPLGKVYILQPDDKFSPFHPLLPLESALYALDGTNNGAGGDGAGSPRAIAGAFRAFLNSPHPLETLSHPTAYGSEGTILRDHDSSNYVEAINRLLKQHTRYVVRRSRKQRQHQWWPLLTAPSNAALPARWACEYNPVHLEQPSLAKNEVLTEA